MNPGTSLIRPREERMVGGVVAGLARRFGWPVGRTRVGFVLLSLLSAAFPGLVVYLLLWLVMPSE
jgi:phage shock protein C